MLPPEARLKVMGKLLKLAIADMVPKAKMVFLSSMIWNVAAGEADMALTVKEEAPVLSKDGHVLLDAKVHQG
jgi:hypothetical protein